MVPPTVERLDMSLDDIIKLQKKSVRRTRPDGSEAPKAERGRKKTSRVVSKPQKNQLKIDKRGGIRKTATFASQPVRGGFVRQRGGMGRQRVGNQGMRPFEQRPQRLQPNGVAMRRRLRPVQQHWQSRGGWMLQGTAHSQQSFKSPTVKRGLQMQQQQQQLQTVPRKVSKRAGRYLGPQGGAVAKQRVWVQTIQRFQPQRQRLPISQSVSHRQHSQRGLKRQLMHQPMPAVQLLHKRGGFRPPPKASSSVFQHTMSAPSAPQTLNERFGSYRRNSGSTGSWNVGRGGLKVIVRQ